MIHNALISVSIIAFVSFVLAGLTLSFQEATSENGFTPMQFNAMSNAIRMR